MNLVSKVGDSLLATKAVGEKPTVFKTKSLDVLLDRQRASDMGGKKLGEGPSGVALPSATSLFSGLEGEGTPEAVDSQVCYVSHGGMEDTKTWEKTDIRSHISSARVHIVATLVEVEQAQFNFRANTALNTHCNLHLVHSYFDNGVATTPKRRILSFVFAVTRKLLSIFKQSSQK